MGWGERESEWVSERESEREREREREHNTTPSMLAPESALPIKKN